MNGDGDIRFTITINPAALPSVSIAVSPAAVDEDGAANLTYTVTRSLNLASATSVNINTAGTATPGSDYTGGVATVVIPTNATTATITIDPNADSTVEPDETVILAVAAGAGYTVAAAPSNSATGTIRNDDVSLPTLTLTKVSNGGTGAFTFTGTNGWTSQTITTAVSGTGVSGATQTLAAASAATTITEAVPPGFLLTGVNCTGMGNGGTATLSGNTLTLSAAATAAGANIACVFTNVRLPTLTLTKVSNGATGAFTFTGTNGWTSQTITTAVSGTGVAGATQTLAAASVATTITEAVAPGFLLTGVSCTGMGGGGTATLSGNTLTLSAAATAAGANIACVFTNVRLPTLTLTKVSNGGTGAFTFTGTNGWTSQIITTAVSGTGVAGATQTLAAASVATTITEAVPPGFLLTGVSCTGMGGGGTATLSGNTLTLSAAATAAGANIACVFTNVRLPTLTLTKVSNGGTGAFTFTGTNGWTSQTITTAVSGTGVAGATQTLAAASVATTITEAVAPGFLLTGVSCTGMGGGGTATLSGNSVILNGAAMAAGANIACTFTNTVIPTLAIVDVSIIEGDGGTATLDFTVTRTGATSLQTGFSFATANGTATADSDYVAVSGTGTIPGGGATATTTVSVTINGDVLFEPDETFFVNLSAPTNATISDAQGIGTIINDDIDPCTAYAFPYTMSGNTPAELIQAIECANANGASSDTINLDDQTITLTASFANVAGTNIGLPQINTPITIRNGTITRNSTQLFRFFLNNSSLTLNSLILSGGNSQGDGGAINNGPAAVLNISNSRLIGHYGNFGGAIFNSNTGTATLTNTLVSGNRSNSQGGGIRNRGFLILNNSTVAGNLSTSGAEGGGGIANAGSFSLTLNNSIVAGNEASNFPAANNIVGAFTNNSSLVGWSPGFVAPLDASETAPTTDGDYRLASFGAAIDAGNNALLPSGVTLDLDGNPRRFDDPAVADTGTGTAPIVDLGAYERQASSQPPEVLVSPTSLTLSEAGEMVGDVVFRLNQAPPTNVTIQISFNDNVRVDIGSGFGASPQTVTLTPANAVAGRTVLVRAVEDAIDEASPHAGNISTAATSSASAAFDGLAVPDIDVAILDNDTAGLAVSETGGSTAVTEGGAPDTYTVVLTSQPTANVTVTLSPSAQLTTALPQLVFGPGDWNVAQSVAVSAVDDGIVEGPQSGTVAHTVTSADANYEGLPVASVAVSIADNDSATVQFNPTSVSRLESAGPMAFTVTLSNPVQSGVTVTVNSAPGTANSPADFTAISSQTVSFAPNSTTSQTVNVTIANDALDEDDENFTLTLSGLTATGDVTLPAGTATATGTILDDDALPVLSVANVTQPEGNATNTLTFTVNLSPVSGRAVSFTRATADGTAVSTAPNADFVAIPSGIVTIPAGQTSVTIPVTINGDTLFEGDEQFTLSLTAVTNATPGSLTATAALTDDDQQPTTTTITADLPDPSAVGEPYPVAVEVRAQTLSPLGTVTITDGTGATCNATLTAGAAPASTMSCMLTSTSAGNKTLTATYAPASSAFGASSDTESHRVDPAATTLTLVGPATVRFNTPASYTATLAVSAPGAGTPAGTVTVTSGAQSCTITLPTATPSCTLSFPTLGSRTVTAAFVPANGDFLGASASPVQTLAFASTDLVVTKDNGITSYEPNDLLVYTVEVENRGPDGAPGVRVLDPVPTGLTNVAWTCVAQGGAICPSAGGAGGIDVVVQIMPSGSRLVFTYYGNVQGSAPEIVNVARAELPANGTLNDPSPGNETATDIDRLNRLHTDGFEPQTVSAPAGAVALPAIEMRASDGRAAWPLVDLRDRAGLAVRVYVRTFDDAVEYALATRGSDDRLRLGPWQRYPVTPTLRWTAAEDRGSWRVTSARLD